MNKNATKASQN